MEQAVSKEELASLTLGLLTYKCNIMKIKKFNYDWHSYDHQFRIEMEYHPISWAATKHGLLLQYQLQNDYNPRARNQSFRGQNGRPANSSCRQMPKKVSRPHKEGQSHLGSAFPPTQTVSPALLGLTAGTSTMFQLSKNATWSTGCATKIVRCNDLRYFSKIVVPVTTSDDTMVIPCWADLNIQSGYY